MQASHLVRAIAAALSITLVALALMGASWYDRGIHASASVRAIVGVPTGEVVDGVEVHRLPSITVTGHRSDVAAE